MLTWKTLKMKTLTQRNKKKEQIRSEKAEGF